MKFARDCRSSESNEATAQLLFEALPWIKNLTGKTVVIKYGGAAMVDEQLRRDVMSDIVLLKIIGMRPVIATVAAGEDGGFFNINADTAAGAVAAALHAHKAIFLTDVDGLYKDFSDKDSLISNLTLDEVNEMLYGGEVDKGMIPKLRAAVDALAGGVFRAHIINGTTPHSLLLELLTDAGVGTVIHSTETAYEFDTHPHPLSTFAARLTENLDEVEKLQTV